jgi:ribosomal protein S18 acetylase RimI-like enzyme
VKLAATTRNSDPQALAWDTGFWNIRVGRATHLDGLSEWAVENTMGLVCLLVDTMPEVQKAEERGFRMMDVRLTLSRPTTMQSSTARLIRDGDGDALVEIARTAFPLTRFYADPRLDDARCGDMYVVWTKALIGGAADAVLVREGSSRVAPGGFSKADPIGYVTINVGHDGTGEIGLIAVKEGMRGGGIGADLVRGAIDLALVRGADRIDVVTQGLNVGAIRTFEACGFRVVRTQFWLHRWYDA